MNRLPRLLIPFFLLTLCLAASQALAQGPFGSPDPGRPVGVTVATDQAAEGYVLVSILQSKDIQLVANDGRVVHRWTSDYYGSNSVYLLDNGDLLQPASLEEHAFATGGQWGFTNNRIEEFNWDGELVWSFEFGDDRIVGHHDIEPMPNGHVLIVAFERFTGEEALAAGRDPALIPETGELWSEAVLEVDPEAGAIVWEWHVWDHLIQDADPAQANYGVVADHPGRIDLNYLDPELNLDADWLHFNAVDYNAERDEIVVSTRSYSEIWIVDHATTTEQAQGAAGDLLFRWGNPAAYDSGSDADRGLVFQHDPNWIPAGYPGEGDLLIFDNGGNSRPYSRIVEIAPVFDENGDYVLHAGEPAPADVVWTYSADPEESFYSPVISGAQRQPNGNTLITDGVGGRIFEVTTEGELAWEYYLPPAAWAFRAERYDLPAFAEFDMTQDLGFLGGIVWGQDCADGAQPRLHEYLPQENGDLNLFIETYGDEAQAHWEAEACAEHGGLAE